MVKFEWLLFFRTLSCIFLCMATASFSIYLNERFGSLVRTQPQVCQVQSGQVMLAGTQPTTALKRVIRQLT